jgi:hypothetical protein
MNIQRKYSLPNCTLLLEGLSDITRTAQVQQLRPELSILVNAECYLPGCNQPISGGREFFESLIRVVSNYAQEFLSNGIKLPVLPAQNHIPELVELRRIGSNQHRLIVHLERAESGFPVNSHSSQQVLQQVSQQVSQQISQQISQQVIQVDLNTVQLFDLVEAVDQFFADSQTLPELSLELQPINAQYNGTNQILVRHGLPAALGVSSLAAAAFAVNLIPLPQVRPPEPKPAQQSVRTMSVTPKATSTPLALLTPSQTAPTSVPVATSSPNTPLVNATPSGLTPISSPTAAITTQPDLQAILTKVPEITDPNQLRTLNTQAYNLINPVWTSRSQLAQNLIYRVGIASNGNIVGYKAVNREANDEIGKTPLPNLLYSPTNRPIANEPIAQFRVVFTRRGVLEVSPWLGYNTIPDTAREKLTDAQALKDLNQKLYNSLRQAWGVTPTFKQALQYRVSVNKDGVIAGYEALNPVAHDYFRETPISQMLNSLPDSHIAPPNQADLAQFQVIFQPNGQLEVSPWKSSH